MSKGWEGDDMSFDNLDLNPLIRQAIDKQQYMKPTPIQEQAIPSLLEGRDLLGCAHTGTGKTAAFAIPILQKLSEEIIDPEKYNHVKALVLAPTRELAIQIGESFKTYGEFLDLYTGVVYGGVTPKRHVKVLKREPSILVATPGRLLDLLEEGYVDFRKVQFLVLDEADRMLDLGMIEDVKAIISHLPIKRQNMLFSATIPKEVDKLVNSILKNPVKVEVKTKPEIKNNIKQQVYFVEQPNKTSLLLDLLRDEKYSSVLVFTRTKIKADKVAKAINVQNIRTKAFHGDKNQSERIKVLDLFKRGEIRVLIATDVAARGIDINNISLVVNMDIPNVPETYIHRIGRTGRAGLLGTSISFCNNQEREFLKRIEDLQGKSIEVVKDHPYVPINIAIKQNRENFAEKKEAKTSSSRSKTSQTRKN